MKPEKWAIVRTFENYKEVNAYFNTLYPNYNFTADGKRFDGKKDYLHYPSVGSKVIYNTLQQGYTEITLEQMKSETKFPKEWSVLSDGFGGELMQFIEDFEKAGYKSLWNGNAKNDYYNFNGTSIWDFTEKPTYEVVTIQQLREHYLKPKENTMIIIGTRIKVKSTESYYTIISSTKGNDFALKTDDGNIYENSYTIKQFEGYIENGTWIIIDQKKIIGYLAPMDLFEQKVPKGTEFRSTGGRDVFFRPTNQTGDVYLLPKEIVKNWEAVYEQEFKEGDWVFIKSTGFKVKGDFKVGDVKQIKRFELLSSSVKWRVDFTDGSFGNGSSLPSVESQFRKATEGEIEATKVIKIKVGSPEAEVEIFKDGRIFTNFKGNVVSETVQSLRWLKDEISKVDTSRGLGIYSTTLKDIIIHVGCSEGIDITLTDINRIIQAHSKL